MALHSMKAEQSFGQDNALVSYIFRFRTIDGCASSIYNLLMHCPAQNFVQPSLNAKP